jgi:hypothetical protein
MTEAKQTNEKKAYVKPEVKTEKIEGFFLVCRKITTPTCKTKRNQTTCRL